MCVRDRLCFPKLCGHLLRITQDAVSALADMMRNRCEAIRRGDVRSCP